jgi:tol-pal system protein YbgF
MTRRARIAGSRGSAAAVTAAALLALLMMPGCYAPQLTALRGGLDSLRTVVDTLTVRDSIAYRVLVQTRRELAEQRDILLSTRATTGSSTKELFDQMGRLEGKLDEVMGRFNQPGARPPGSAPGAEGTPGAAAPAGDPNQLYEQAAQDLTQGRYPLAQQEFRDFVRVFPGSELADNAQYGLGESFFAQSKFDSAAVEYARVEALFPQGDKVPAALYKLSLAQEKLGQAPAARRTLEDLVKRYPLSGEAQLARDRLGKKRR